MGRLVMIDSDYRENIEFFPSGLGFFVIFFVLSKMPLICCNKLDNRSIRAYFSFRNLSRIIFPIFLSRPLLVVGTPA